MNRNIRKTILFTLIISSLLTFVSCGYEPIFYGIMHDVAPEPATVNGNITSIARCTINGEEYLFTTGNGALIYKPNSSAAHGEWTTFSGLPFELHRYNYFPSAAYPVEGHLGQQILKVISDNENIYLLTSSFTTDTQYGIVLPDQFYLWTKPLSTIISNPSTGWKNLTENQESNFYVTQYDSEIGEFNTFFDIFATNSPKNDHRKAFMRVTKVVNNNIVYEYYPLNGQTTCPPVKDTSIGTSNYIATLSENTRVNSAFYIGNTLYFSDSFAVTTNENFTSNADYACLAGVDSSYNLTRTLYTTEGGAVTKLMDLGSTVASLALTGDSLLIGKGSYNSSPTVDGGIDRVLLENGRPATTISDFDSGNNAKYQFTSSYIIMTLLSADPSKIETESCLYATISYRGVSSSSSASPANIGLWSYYPARGNWNRE